MPVYLELSRGTDSPKWWDIKSPAMKGPILGPMAYVRTTNAGDLRCCPLDAAGRPAEDAAVELQVTEDCLLFYGGMRFIEWSVTDGASAMKSWRSRRRIKQVQRGKASRPDRIFKETAKCAPRKKR